MNRTQLVDALAERLGDRRTAVAAVEGLLETIVDTVRSGDSVSLTGFGVFEGRARAARTARNPRTGEAVEVPATTVPAFRPGASFRTAVGGGRTPAPRSVATRSRVPAVDAAPAAAEAAPEKPVQRRAAKSRASFAAAEPVAEKSGKAGKPAGKTEKAPKSARKPKSSKAAEKPAEKLAEKPLDKSAEKPADKPKKAKAKK
jgi:DNA-binding protein HU-beta